MVLGSGLSRIGYRAWLSFGRLPTAGAAYAPPTEGVTTFLKVVYDAAAKRDNTTALDLLTGVGLPAVHRSGEPEIFSPPEAWCPYVSPEDKMAAVNAQLAAVPKPANYEARIAALQATLGKSVAPQMQEIRCGEQRGPRLARRLLRRVELDRATAPAARRGPTHGVRSCECLDALQ